MMFFVFGKNKVHFTLPETNNFAPEHRPFAPNRKIVFQPSICGGELLVSGSD